MLLKIYIDFFMSTHNNVHVLFSRPEDAEKCVKESQGGKTFFGTKVKVILHDGIGESCVYHTKQEN